MKILITGTPGVGKTTISIEIKRKYGYKHINLSKYIKDKEIFDEYDKEYNTYIYDEENVRTILQEDLKDEDDFIIDTHSPELVNFIDFDFIFLLKISTSILFKRLSERGYSEKKIKENINCEIFDVVEDLIIDNYKSNYHIIGNNEDQLKHCKIFEKIDEKIKKN